MTSRVAPVRGSAGRRQPSRLRLGKLIPPVPWILVLALATGGCAAPAPDARDNGLSEFAEDASISGRVLENSTACTVDAVCFLRIEFADRTVVALYGTGERPRPACAITTEVSDVAFEAEPGEIVTVVVSPCATERYFLSRITRGSD